MSDVPEAIANEINEFYENYEKAFNETGKASPLDATQLITEFVDLPFAELRSGSPMVVRSTLADAAETFERGFTLMEEAHLGALEVPNKKIWALAPDLALLSVDYTRPVEGGGDPISGRVIYVLSKHSGQWKYVFYVYLEPGFNGPDPTPASTSAATAQSTFNPAAS